MPACACQTYRQFRGRLRPLRAPAARIGLSLAALAIAPAICRSQVPLDRSEMTRPVGSDSSSTLPGDPAPANTRDGAPSPSPMLDLNVPLSNGSSNPPGLLAEGSSQATPPGPEQLPGSLQADGPNGAGTGTQLAIDGQIGSMPPPAERSPGGFRRLFGPEPNGNWNSEPVHFDTFLGFLDDRTAQNTGVLGGFRLGWDYDTYWGLETRLGFTSLQEDTGPVVIWDESLLYYPWGDSRVRPYFTLGLGLNEFRIVDPGDEWHHRQNLVDLPFGVGFKYRLHEWLVLRFDILDNLAFGSGSLGTMNNFSFTTGFEFRFGGAHYNYWPWDPAPAR